MGGRDLVYKCMGFVVESVLEQACVRLVCTSVGLAGLGLEALVAGCHNRRLKQSCAAVEGVLSRAGRSGDRLASLLKVGSLIRKNSW